MKNKIRRAFDLTKPNVMNRVLEDCPVPENIAAKPKRKRLSDRTVRFISVAASFAILISAVGGGFVYFRDYFEVPGVHSGSSGSNEEPNNTTPDPNLGWDTPEDRVMISETHAKKIALEHAQGSMGACKVVSCELVANEYYKVGISGEMLCWYSDVYVDAYSGEIIERTIPADLIPEEEAKKIALAKAEEEYEDCIVYTCDLVDYTYYRVGISCAYPNGSYTGEETSAFLGIVYFVNADTGEFRNPSHIGSSGTASGEDEARKIASAQANALYDSFLITNCEFHFRSGLHSFYDFTLLAETDHGTEEVHFVVIDWLAYQAVDDPVDPPIGQTLTMSGARDIALGMWDHYVDNIHCLKIAENSDFYTVYYEQGEYAYEFHIDFDGNVLYDSGAQQIGLRADQQMGHLIGWEKARSIALDACGRNVSELIGFTYDYHPGDPDSYHLELYFPDDAFSYRIGALNGELLEGQTSPQPLDYSVSNGYWHSSENMPDAFSYYLVTSVEELNTLHEGLDHPCTDKYDAAFFQENALLFLDLTTHTSLCHCEVTQFSQDAQGNLILGVTCYTPEVITDDIGYCSLVVEIHQTIHSGTPVAYSFGHHVLTQDEWNALLAGTYPGDQRIDVETAAQIALEYTGHLEDYAAGNVTDLACKFDEYGNPAAYYVYFCVGNEHYEVGILATSGEVLFCNGWAVDEPILDGPFTKEDAIQAALGYSHLNADNYPVIECHQIGTDPGRTIYLVICKGGVTVTTMVDASTLRIMDSGMTSFPDVALTEQEARSIAYQACGLEEESPMCTAMIGMFNDGVQFYCAKVYWDEMVYVVVMDANTGEVLAQSKFENTRIPGHIITQEAALEYALANAFVSLADAEDPTVVHDPDSQTYTVTFRYQGDTCTAIVDDYYGSIIDLYWIVDE